jgi:hypothetical protein
VFEPWTNFINDQLPPDLDTWMPGNTHEAEEKIWKDLLHHVFRDEAYTLWPHVFLSTLVSPGQTYPLASGLGYATPRRGIINETDSVGTVRSLIQFDYIVGSY